MTSSRPDITWNTLKRDLALLENCLKESQTSCEALERSPVSQLQMELGCARQQIRELTSENLTLRMLLKNAGRSGVCRGEIGESLQSKIDWHLLEARHENEAMRERIRVLEDEVQCLMQQLTVYREDFEMERRDRENAHGQISDLQKQVTSLTRDTTRTGYYPPRPHQCYQHPRIRGFDVCDFDLKSAIGYSCVDNERDTNSRTGGQSNSVDRSQIMERDPHGEFDVCDLHESDVEPENSRLVGRGFDLPSRFCVDGEAPFLRLTSEPLPNDSTIDSLPRRNLRLPLTEQKNCDTVATLSCPCCFKIFSTEDHWLLLEHLEVCG